MRIPIHMLYLLCALAAQAMGQAASPSGDATPGAANSCVDVTINGHQALSYDCLNRRLMSSATMSSGNQLGDLDAVTREPSNRQVGQFNFSALSNRMGNQLGHSVTPQRPPSPPPPTTLLGMPIGVH
jgi:hypothetical protein